MPSRSDRHGPCTPPDFGVYWLRSAALGPQVDGGMVTFGLPGTGGAISVRGGAAQDDEDDLSVFGGVDLRASIATHDHEQPLDIAWVGVSAPARRRTATGSPRSAFR